MSEGIPKQIASIDTLFLELPPSCIEFWHLHPEYFVIGTYFLKNPEQHQEQGNRQEENLPNDGHSSAKKAQERTGSLVLCKLNDNKLEIVDTCKTDYAILDVHFAYAGNGKERVHTSTFWTANSTGSIAEYEIIFPIANASPTIEQRSIHQLYAEDILVLSFCWHPHDANLMSTTLSNGEVHVIRKRAQARDEKETMIWETSAQKPMSHELEAWTSCFSSTGEELLFSGGDDAVLQYTTTPTAFQHKQDDEADSEESPTPKTLPKKFHNAGITSILPLHHSLLLTGSYDDHIRLLLTHPRPTLLADLNLGGGVWRLKLLSSSNEAPNEASNEEKGIYDILASCMHAGTRIVRLTMDGVGETGFEVLATFEENESMNYGSDVQPRREGGEEVLRGFVVVSTSFYDRRVCLWRFDGMADGMG
ncbi:hypothetical protein FKW77_006799 [Venturia effusa]|uniref:Anaphase-promoting complex subunit 4 WD40 domain-containing protein n=1 Tax=Venturia effusa TaxID=50376 RepID=A0A517L7M1_9PEZI|nr:hypothetical protein FKW77_006799 [Venturia effusa]